MLNLNLSWAQRLEGILTQAIVFRAKAYAKALVAALAIFSAAAGCAEVKENVLDSANMEPGTGILVLRLHATATGPFGTENLEVGPLSYLEPYLTYGKAGNASIEGKIRLNDNPDLKVISMPAGQYEWRSLTRPGNPNFTWPLYSEFEVVDGMINYIGDLYIDFRLAFGEQTPLVIFGMLRSAATISVRNEQEDIKTSITNKFPQLVNSHPFRARVLPIRLTK